MAGYAVRRERRVQTGLFHLLGHPGGVLGHLGQRHVGVGDVQAAGLQLGLQPAQPSQGPDRGASTQTSALCPSIAAVTTWQPSLRAVSIAAISERTSAPGLGLQNRCSTPHPVLGLTGESSGTGSSKATAWSLRIARESGAGPPADGSPLESLRTCPERATRDALGRPWWSWVQLTRGLRISSPPSRRREARREPSPQACPRRPPRS